MSPLELARRNANLTREALARKAGVGVKTIYNAEHQTAIPRFSTRLALCSALTKVTSQRHRPADLWPDEAHRGA